MYQAACRLVTLVSDAITDDKPDDARKSSKHELDVHASYFDQDGISNVSVRYAFHIKYLEGEQDITTLDVYLFRSMKDSDKVKDTSRKKKATRFHQAITERYLSCDGWTSLQLSCHDVSTFALPRSSPSVPLQDRPYESDK